MLAIINQYAKMPAQRKTSHIHPPRSSNRTSMHMCASVHVDYNNVWVSSILSIAMKDFIMKNRYCFGIMTITS